MYKAFSVRCQRCTNKKITLRCIVIGACAVQFLLYIPQYRNTQHYATLKCSVKRVYAPEAHKEYYLSLPKCLREQSRQIRADLWKENSWILHHDNALSHKAIIVNEFLSKDSINIIEQPPYSPDMAPADFFLFSKLKLPLRDTRFQSIKDKREFATRTEVDSGKCI